MAQNYRGDASHLETLTQVRRLTLAALNQIGPRFEELDGQTGEGMAALRNADSQRTFIRSNRDWLYRTQRAWQSLLTEWDLAPRYMPVSEWSSLSRPAKRKQDKERLMEW